MTDQDLRYPIGPFHLVASLTGPERQAAIESIAALPSLVRDAVRGLTDEQLDTSYRPGGWTIRQVVHHLPDSHVNSYVRFKLGVTEDNPGVKAYNEALWAELEDGKSAPVEVSLALLEAVHDRWIRFLRSLAPGDFSRSVIHPDYGPVSLDSLLALYDWHGRHHVAHITGLRERMGWS